MVVFSSSSEITLTS